MSWTFGPLPLAGSPTAGGAVPSVDTWAGASQAPCRRVAALAVYALALAFVPVVAAASSADIAAGVQGGAPPLRTTTLQYQAVTGPVFVPAVAGETVTVDKWISQPSGRPALRWRPAGGTVAPLHVPDVTDPAPLRSWSVIAPDVIKARVLRPLGGVVAPVAPVAEAPASTDQAPGTQGGAPPLRATTLQYQTLSGPVLVPAVAEAPFDWAGQATPAPALVRRPLGAVVAPLYVADVTVVAPPLGWCGLGPDAIAPRPRAVVLSQTVAPLDVADVTTVAPPRAWAPTYPDRAPGRPRPVDYQQSVEPLVVPDVTVIAPLRSWSAIAPDVVRPRALPALGGIVGPVAPVADAPVSTDQAPGVQGGAPPLRSSTTQYQALTGPVLVPAAAPAVALDWATSLPSGPFAKDGPAIQYAPLTGPVERVLDLDWLGQSPDPVRARRVVTGGTVAPVAPVAAAPAVVLDWIAVPPVAPIRPSRPASGTVAPLYVADVTVIAPLRSWAPVAVDVPRARRVVLGGSVAPLVTTAPAEVVTLDKWHGASAVRPVSRRAGATVTSAPVFVPDVTVDPCTWMPVWSGPVPIRPRPTGGSVAPVVVPDVTVVPPLRSWAPILPERRDIQRPVNVGGLCGRIDPPSPYVPTYRYTAVVPREDRAIVVPGESRAVVVAYESRLIVVPYESRVIIVPRDPRAASQED